MLKACIIVDHIDKIFGGPPLVDADWCAFCQAIYKGIEGSEWGELYHHYRDFCKAAGAKKNQVRVKRQRRYGLRRQPKMDGMISMTWLGKTTSWEGIRRDWSCGKNISKTPSPRGAKL